ncbi:MAG TPA: UDP-2,3-diacylglucosamine diphosphatase LpxI [bacterium]|nr:UDP-2,3-diacylglucosamine diphosphatase LpxI [bacterium]
MSVGRAPDAGGADVPPVGLIAAAGALPVEIARGAKRLGREVICVNVLDGDPALEGLAEAYYAISLGELGGLIGALRRHGVREVLLAGKVDKLAAMRSVRLDAQGAQVALRFADLRDASILSVFVGVLEEAGFEVASQTRYVGHLIPEAGVLGRRAPTSEEARDIALGVRVARGVAGLDVGQAVAVRRGVVVAVEAAEGTDAMIQRAGALARGVSIVKVSRPNQDPRYDLPVVGPQTIAALAGAAGAALAVEAARTILLDRERLVAAADAAGIAVASVDVAPGMG